MTASDFARLVGLHGGFMVHGESENLNAAADFPGHGTIEHKRTGDRSRFGWRNPSRMTEGTTVEVPGEGGLRYALGEIGIAWIEPPADEDTEPLRGAAPVGPETLATAGGHGGHGGRYLGMDWGSVTFGGGAGGISKAPVSVGIALKRDARGLCSGVVSINGKVTHQFELTATWRRAWETVTAAVAEAMEARR